MNYHDILHDDMRNGDGLRVVLFVSGCDHYCDECQNPQTWDSQSGIVFDASAKDEIFTELCKDHIAGITFSGGDPLYQVEAFTELARRIKEETGKNIWCYTGFTYEEILADKRLSMILPYIDTLVDGPFIASLRDTELHFRGSSNQRIIHLHGSEEESIPGTVSVIPYK